MAHIRELNLARIIAKAIFSESNMKTIKYYRKNIWGLEKEYVVDKGDAKIIQGLTGQKTINSMIRELLRDLTAGQIVWEEVLAP